MTQVFSSEPRPILEARDLRKSYLRGGGTFSTNDKGSQFTAVDGVSFQVAQGEPLP